MKQPSPRALLGKLFGGSAKGIAVEKSLITGYAQVGGKAVCVIGTCNGTYIGNEAALVLAAHVIDCIERHPRTPIVMLVDSAGQEPNRLDEMLGLASYFGHLLSCLEVARRKGHNVHTLFTLMEAVDDTTVLYRGGADAGSFVRGAAAEFLAAGGCYREGWFDRAEQLHRTFIARNLSPGGCADLLAATLLVVRCSDR